MTALFTAADMAWLVRPHVARAWFGSFDLPSGYAYLHSGVGIIDLGGQQWRGVSDPIGGRLVGISEIEDQVFGRAAAVRITLTGANKEFIQSVHASAREIEGRRADIYFVLFDQETQTPWPRGLAKLFPRGWMTSPAIQWSGIGRRVVELTVEGMFSPQNFPPGGRWNSANQRQRFPGDLGLDYIDKEIKEVWR